MNPTDLVHILCTDRILQQSFLDPELLKEPPDRLYPYLRLSPASYPAKTQLTVRIFRHALALTLKCCAFCLSAAAGAAAFYTDLSGMALALLIVHAVRCLTVDLALRRRLSCYIAVRISFAFLETVTAGLLRSLCRVPSYHDPIQVTVEILVVCTCLYGTS